MPEIPGTETFIMWDVLTVYMTVIPKKVTRKNGKTYYSLVDEKRVNGKVVQKYVGYLGKSPNSKREITYHDAMKYVQRLMSAEITDVEISDILKKIGIDVDIKPITRIVLENDRKIGKIFLRIK